MIRVPSFRETSMWSMYVESSPTLAKPSPHHGCMDLPSPVAATVKLTKLLANHGAQGKRAPPFHIFRQETALSRIFRCLRIPNTEKVSRKRPSLQEPVGCWLSGIVSISQLKSHREHFGEPLGPPLNSAVEHSWNLGNITQSKCTFFLGIA